MFHLFVALCIFGGTLSTAAKLQDYSIIGPKYKDACEKLEGVKDFNLTRFSGFWYLVQGSADNMRHSRDICPIFDFVVHENDVFEIISYAGSGQMMMQDKFNSSKFQLIEQLNYIEEMVLATDYRSYAVLYSCPELNNGTKLVQVLARTHAPFDPEFDETIENVLTKINLTQRDLISMNLKPCKGIQMVGRGKDEFRDPRVNKGLSRCNLKDIEDFDLNRFMGTWYEMQSSIRSYKLCEPSIFSLVANGTKLHILSSSEFQGFYEVNPTSPAILKSSHTKWSSTTICTVLKTDYKSYAILYIYPMLFNELQKNFVTLARKYEMTDDFRKKIDDAFAENDLGVKYLFANSRSYCEADSAWDYEL